MNAPEDAFDVLALAWRVAAEADAAARCGVSDDDSEALEFTGRVEALTRELGGGPVAVDRPASSPSSTADDESDGPGSGLGITDRVQKMVIARAIAFPLGGGPPLDTMCRSLKGGSP